MKKAVNLRLDEHIVVMLNELSEEFHTTKTEIVERAIKRFSKESGKRRERLRDFAGSLNDKDAEGMLRSIEADKNCKDFTLDI